MRVISTRNGRGGLACVLLLLCGTTLLCGAATIDGSTSAVAAIDTVDDKRAAVDYAEPLPEIGEYADGVDSQEVATNGDDSSAMYENGGSDEVDTPQRAYALFRENYITKEAAERLRALLESRTEPLSQKDYDELLANLVVQHKPRSPMFYKKYFDYLPATDASELEPLDVEFEPLIDAEVISAEEGAKAPFMRPAPQLHEEDIVAVNRAKRDLFSEHRRVIQQQRNIFDRQFEQQLRFSRQRAQQLADEANRWVLEQSYSANPWASGDLFTAGPTNVYLPARFEPAPLDFGYVYRRPLVPFVINPPGGHNIGTPPDNTPINNNVVPLKPTVRPTKAPAQSSSTDSDAGMTVGVRIGDDDEDRVVWDSVPISNVIPGSGPRNNVPTTGLPPPSAFTPPPLQHNSDDQEIIPPRPSSANRPPGAVIRTTDAPIVRRPPIPAAPGLMHNSDDDRLEVPARPQFSGRPGGGAGTGRDGLTGIGSAAGGSITAPVWSIGRVPQAQSPPQQPQQQQQPRRWPAPPTRAPRPPAPSAAGPSGCVWAIVDCCAHRNRATRENCFERIGCQGAFWDVDPCSDSVLGAAINEADQYFN